MIKTKFKELNQKPVAKLLFDDYIPFSLLIGDFATLPETIYARNLNGENFIEFRFEQNSKQLYEITMVALDVNTIIKVDHISIKGMGNKYFSCLINEGDGLNISAPTKIYRSLDAFSLVWDNDTLNYFSITNTCVLGVNGNSDLSSVTITSLTEEQLVKIFGI